MLLKIVSKMFFRLNECKVVLKRVLLLVSLFFLRVTQQPFTSMSFESLLTHFVFDPKQEFYEKQQPFEEKPPYETIFIKIEGTEEFESKIRDLVSRMKVMTRSIKITREDAFEHYFIKLTVEEGPKNYYNVYPLRNFQPNTEIALLSRCVFKHRLLFKASDLFYEPFDNFVDLTLQNNDVSRMELCRLLRYFLNLQSHYYGLYYYVPLQDGFIKAEKLFIFTLFIFLILCFDLKTEFDVFSALSAAILFMISPICCLLYIKAEGKAMYLLLFTIINLKFAFLYAVICYVIEVIKEVKKLKNLKGSE